MPRSRKRDPPPTHQTPAQSDPHSEYSYSYSDYSSDEEAAVAADVQVDGETLRQQCKLKEQEAERLRTENERLKRQLELSEKEGEKRASSSKLEEATRTRRRNNKEEEEERRGAEKKKTKEKERERPAQRTREKNMEAAKEKEKKEQRAALAADAATRDASTMANARTAVHRDVNAPGAQAKKRPRVPVQIQIQPIQRKGSIQEQPLVVRNSAVAEVRPRKCDQDNRGSGSGKRRSTIVSIDEVHQPSEPDYGADAEHQGDDENDDKDKASSDGTSSEDSDDDPAVKDERRNTDWSPAISTALEKAPTTPPGGPRGSGSRPHGPPTQPATPPPAHVATGGIGCVYIIVDADNTGNTNDDHLAAVALDLRKHGATIILASCGNLEVAAKLSELLHRPPNDSHRGSGERPEIQYECSRYFNLLIAGRVGIVKNVAPGSGEPVGAYDCFSTHVSFSVPFGGMLDISVAVAACRPTFIRGRKSGRYCPIKPEETIRLGELLLDTNVRVLGANLHGPLHTFLDTMRQSIPIQVAAWHPWTHCPPGSTGPWSNYVKPAYIFVPGPVASVKARRAFGEVEVVDGALPAEMVDFMFPDDICWQTTADEILKNTYCRGDGDTLLCRRGDGDTTIDWPTLPDISQKAPHCILDGTTKLSIFSCTSARRSEAATVLRKEKKQRNRSAKDKAKNWESNNNWKNNWKKGRRSRKGSW